MNNGTFAVIVFQGMAEAEDGNCVPQDVKRTDQRLRHAKIISNLAACICSVHVEFQYGS